MYSIDASEDTAELKEQVARLNGHVSFLQTEKASLEKEKSSLAEKLSTLQHRVEELKSLGDRVPLLEAEVEKVPLLEAELEKYRPLESKLREREAEIEELVNLVPARCDQAVAEFKESEEFKALLQSARNEAITEKFTEWSAHGYLDKPRMLADLLAAQEKARTVGPQLADPEEHPVVNPESSGAVTLSSEGEDAEDVEDPVGDDLD